MAADITRRPPQSTLFKAFVYFLRIVAVLCLASGLRYWALLSGVMGESLWRFDLMPGYWQVASSALAVLLPVAAVGLWMPASWGAVIWFVAAAGETAMYLGFPHLFGEKPIISIMHLTVAVIYLGFRLALYREKRLSRRPVSVDSPY